MTNNRCCFLGHRKIEITDELRRSLYDIVEGLIKDEGIDTFLFGSASKFDSLCYETVTELMEKYPEIKRVYVRAEFPFIDEKYRSYLLESYEETYFPEKIISAGRAVYIERNREMIDKSRVCVFYFKDDYRPPESKSDKNSLTYKRKKSGTAAALEYALKKEKVIINFGV